MTSYQRRLITLGISLSIYVVGSVAPQATGNLSTVSGTGKHLYRGDKVNMAREMRESRYWSDSLAEVRRIVLSSASFNQRIALTRATRPMIRAGSPARRVVALTFDDGPRPQKTLELLSILHQEKVRANFFIVGKMAERYPELVRAIASNGHVLGNHSFSHVSMTKCSTEAMKVEYMACTKVIEDLTGITPAFCRPPGGATDPRVLEAGQWNGMTSTFWTINPGDFKNPGSDFVRNFIINRLHPGAIIVLHDGVDQMLDTLPLLIKEIRAKGYSFVGLDEMLRDTRVPAESR